MQFFTYIYKASMRNFYFNKIMAYTIIGITLCGCFATGPIYSTSYTFVPPKGKEGETCANECLVVKQRCQEVCYQTDSNQIADALINMIGEVKKEKEDLSFHEEFVEKGRRREAERFKRKKYTDCLKACDSNHRLCHTNCGGEVIANVKCIGNCNLINK